MPELEPALEGNCHKPRVTQYFRARMGPSGFGPNVRAFGQVLRLRPGRRCQIHRGLHSGPRLQQLLLDPNAVCLWKKTSPHFQQSCVSGQQCVARGRYVLRELYGGLCPERFRRWASRGSSL